MPDDISFLFLGTRKHEKRMQVPRGLTAACSALKEESCLRLWTRQGRRNKKRPNQKLPELLCRYFASSRARLSFRIFIYYLAN